MDARSGGKSETNPLTIVARTNHRFHPRWVAQLTKRCQALAGYSGARLAVRGCLATLALVLITARFIPGWPPSRLLRRRGRGTLTHDVVVSCRPKSFVSSSLFPPWCSHRQRLRGGDGQYRSRWRSRKSSFTRISHSGIDIQTCMF